MRPKPKQRQRHSVPKQLKANATSGDSSCCNVLEESRTAQQRCLDQVQRINWHSCQHKMPCLRMVVSSSLSPLARHQQMATSTSGLSRRRSHSSSIQKYWWVHVMATWPAASFARIYMNSYIQPWVSYKSATCTRSLARCVVSTTASVLTATCLTAAPLASTYVIEACKPVLAAEVHYPFLSSADRSGSPHK